MIFKSKYKSPIQENTYPNVVCQMSAILSRHQCVKGTAPARHQWKSFKKNASVSSSQVPVPTPISLPTFLPFNYVVIIYWRHPYRKLSYVTKYYWDGGIKSNSDGKLAGWVPPSAKLVSEVFVLVHFPFATTPSIKMAAPWAMLQDSHRM